MQIKLKIDNFSLYPLDIKRTGVYICTVVILFFVRLQNPLGQRHWGVF